MSGREQDIPEYAARFETKYVVRPDGCWVWIRAVDRHGYGRFWLNGKHHLAHRVSYAMANGAAPEGLTLDHLCRNRSCVNPDHLEPVTGAINVLRGEGFPAVNAVKTACPSGHVYDGENTYVNQGRRHCRKCSKRRAEEYRRRNPGKHRDVVKRWRLRKATA